MESWREELYHSGVGICFVDEWTEELKHYGVKGMKWGQVKANKEPTNPKAGKKKDIRDPEYVKLLERAYGDPNIGRTIQAYFRRRWDIEQRIMDLKWKRDQMRGTGIQLGREDEYAGYVKQIDDQIKKLEEQSKALQDKERELWDKINPPSGKR